MSTEQKKEHLETNALGEKLAGGWDQFKQGKLIGYKWMAVILVAVTALGVWLYIRSEKVAGASKTWMELEGANTVTSLEEFAKNNPDTTAGKLARVHIARYQLGPDGIEKLVTRDEAERKKAVESVEKARDSLAALADEFKNDPVIRAECYLGLAKAEAGLIGISKEGKIDEFRGSVGKMTEWLDKLAEAADGTPWGEDAKKMSAALKSPAGPLPEELRRVQTNLYNMALLPSLPGAGSPTAPPGGPPTGAIPGLPGFPGGISGGPLAPLGGPPTTPSVTPTPPTAAPAPPVGTAPVPPAVAPLTPGGQASTPATPAPVAPPPTPPEPPKK